MNTAYLKSRKSIGHWQMQQLDRVVLHGDIKVHKHLAESRFIALHTMGTETAYKRRSTLPISASTNMLIKMTQPIGTIVKGLIEAVRLLGRGINSLIMTAIVIGVVCFLLGMARGVIDLIGDPISDMHLTQLDVLYWWLFTLTGLFIKSLFWWRKNDGSELRELKWKVEELESKIEALEDQAFVRIRRCDDDFSMLIA